MAKYRKVDPRIWNDEKFRLLSHSGKLVFLFLMTHPHMTALGAMRATIPGLSAELEMLPKAFGEAFAEAFRKGMLEHDPKASFIALPRFLKYNGPESPNVVKAWSSSLDLLPECDLKNKLIQRVKAFAEALPEAFAEALPEAFAKSMPYQEQEQEQELEQEKTNTHVAPQSLFPEPEKKPYGEFGHALLTDREHAELVSLMDGNLTQMIRRFDEFVHEAPNAKSSGVKRKDRNAYLTIRNWYNIAVKEGKIKRRRMVEPPEYSG